MLALHAFFWSLCCFLKHASEAIHYSVTCHPVKRHHFLSHNEPINIGQVMVQIIVLSIPQSPTCWRLGPQSLWSMVQGLISVVKWTLSTIMVPTRWTKRRFLDPWRLRLRCQLLAESWGPPSFPLDFPTGNGIPPQHRPHHCQLPTDARPLGLASLMLWISKLWAKIHFVLPK